MKIRFFHIKLLPMKQDCQVISEAELWIEDGVVVYAGDAEGARILPGFLGTARLTEKEIWCFRDLKMLTPIRP